MTQMYWPCDKGGLQATENLSHIPQRMAFYHHRMHTIQYFHSNDLEWLRELGLMTNSMIGPSPRWRLVLDQGLSRILKQDQTELRLVCSDSPYKRRVFLALSKMLLLENSKNTFNISNCTLFYDEERTETNSPFWQPNISRRKQAPSVDQDCGLTRKPKVMIGWAKRWDTGLTASWLPRKFCNGKNMIKNMAWGISEKGYICHFI